MSCQMHFKRNTPIKQSYMHAKQSWLVNIVNSGDLKFYQNTHPNEAKAKQGTFHLLFLKSRSILDLNMFVF